MGDLDEALGVLVDLAHHKRLVQVAVPAVEKDRHVHVDDVAALQRALVGDAVTDDLCMGWGWTVGPGEGLDRSAVSPLPYDRGVPRLGHTHTHTPSRRKFGGPHTSFTDVHTDLGKLK